MIEPFNFSRIPEILFGPGRINEISGIINRFGSNVLLITGGNSLRNSGNLDKLDGLFKKNSISCSIASVKGEPSPVFVDETAGGFREGIDAVIAVGGGSVIDAGKAVSAMITQDRPVTDFMEGIGESIHNGHKIPFIAVPTTSGTGSEATKNAVLSIIGPGGYKKSLRHDNFVPDYAILDPELMITSPSAISASTGMDAFTQLLESYVSIKSNPITDALAYSGMTYVKDNLVEACTAGAGNLDVRGAMAYASLISGITLANSGLGIVHGLASPLGGCFEIPHGVVCGTLLGAATEMNIRSLKQKKENIEALEKYALVGALLGESEVRKDQIDHNLDLLIEKISNWTDELGIKRLGDYGISKDDIEKMVSLSGNKNNPVKLASDEIRDILLKRI